MYILYYFLCACTVYYIYRFLWECTVYYTYSDHDLGNQYLMTYSIVLCMDSLPKLPVPLADFISEK